MPTESLVAGGLLSADECREIAGLYDLQQGFQEPRHHGAVTASGGESTDISPTRLRPIIHALRTSLYCRLVTTANRWNALMGF